MSQKVRNALLEALEAAPCSLRALAREAGVSHTALRRIRSGDLGATPAVASKVAAALEKYGVAGWVSHPKDIPGRPDFYFPRERVAVFVNGCFWHGCPKCGRIPKSRVNFWLGKIQANRKRDRRVRRLLRHGGYKTLTIWEHTLRKPGWFRRLERVTR